MNIAKVRMAEVYSNDTRHSGTVKPNNSNHALSSRYFLKELH